MSKPGSPGTGPKPGTTLAVPEVSTDAEDEEVLCAKYGFSFFFMAASIATLAAKVLM